MPFGLKNTEATYQRLVNKIFEPIIGKTMEVYVNDMIIKSVQDGGHNDDLRETFEILQRYDMTFKPKKYVFRVWSGKFLGFMISNRGIEVNLNKVKVVLDLSPHEIRSWFSD